MPHDLPVPRTSAGSYLALTVAVSAIAAAAAFGSAVLTLAPWAMFVGWVAYFTRPASPRQALFTGVCLWLGLAAGAGAMLAIGALMPVLGPLSLLLVVFVVAIVVVSMRAVPVANNILAWFLGLIALFAAQRAPTLTTVAQLGAAGSIGIAAGLAAHALQNRLARPAR